MELTFMRLKNLIQIGKGIYLFSYQKINTGHDNLATEQQSCWQFI